MECLKKTAFISQPMKGKTAEAIRKERRRIEEMLILNGYKPVDSVFESFPEAEEKYKTPALAYLAKSLDLLAQCDAVCFAPGWKNARGCQIEHTCAEQYGIEIIME